MSAGGPSRPGAGVPIQVRRRSEHRTMPWRNGGGITHELASAASTEGGDFDWRVSIAEIEAAGPFSAFPGVDRIITLIEGPWLELTVDGAHHRLAPLEPFAFDGGAETSCEIPSRTVDLNAMCAAGRCAADVGVLRVEKPQAVAGAAPLLLVALAGTVQVTASAEPGGGSDEGHDSAAAVELDPWDLATVPAGPVTLSGSGVVAAISLRATPGR